MMAPCVHHMPFSPTENTWIGAKNPQDHAKVTALGYKDKPSPSNRSRIGRKHFREVLRLGTIWKKNNKMGAVFLSSCRSQLPNPFITQFPINVTLILTGSSSGISDNSHHQQQLTGTMTPLEITGGSQFLQFGNPTPSCSQRGQRALSRTT